MAEEDKPAEESAATATEEPPEAEEENAEEQVSELPVLKPISIPRDELTEKARTEALEEKRGPVADVPYSIEAEENKPGAVLSIDFKVAPEDFGKELNRYYDALRKDVTLPGFRKGKAPIKLVRIRMGDDGDRDSMIETALNVARQEAIKRELKPIADAQIVKWEIVEGEPLPFTVEFEIDVPVELTEYKGLSVEVQTHEVGDDAVEAEVEKIRQSYGRLESAPEGTVVSAGDSIVVDVRVVGESGNELKHLAREDWTVQNYKAEFPPELAEKMDGLKVGDSADAEITQTRTSRRGEEIKNVDTFTVTVKAIKKTQYPDLDDEFAKDLGDFDSLDALKKSIRDDLRKTEEDRRRGESIGKIFEAIIEKNEFDAPRSLIAQAEYHSVARDSYQLSRMGLKLQDVVGDAGAYFSGHHATAEMQVKQGMAAARLGELEKFEVSDEELEDEIKEMAERAGRKPLAVRASLEAEKRLDALKDELLDRKVGSFLLENNTVNFVEAPAVEEEDEAEAKEASAEEEKPKAEKKAAKKKAPAKKAVKKAAKKTPAKKSTTAKKKKD